MSFLSSVPYLCLTLGWGQTTVLIFLDKDIDDHLRTKKRSPHVTYTPYYDIENHLFRSGDLMNAVAVAASVDPTRLMDHATINQDWCLRAAVRWKQWVTFCVFVRKYGLAAANFRVTSRINRPVNGPVDESCVEEHHASLRLLWPSGMGDYDEAFGSCEDYVERIFARGEHDRLFRGKWYATLLECDVKCAGLDGARHAGLAKRVGAALMTTLDFEQDWAKPFRAAVNRVLDLV